MKYEHFVAARRQWLEEDRATRQFGSGHEPVARRFRRAPRKTWWRRLVDWWRALWWIAGQSRL